MTDNRNRVDWNIPIIEIREDEFINEYAEGESVCICAVTLTDGRKRLVVKARNEAGYNYTLVDLQDLIDVVQIAKVVIAEQTGIEIRGLSDD